MIWLLVVNRWVILFEWIRVDSADCLLLFVAICLPIVYPKRKTLTGYSDKCLILK